MDQFYLENATYYQTLVARLDVHAPTAHFSRQRAAAVAGPTAARGRNVEVAPGQQQNAAMVISARIRPMLKSDTEAGFPCAAYPRARQDGRSQVVDLHDLYNYPWGRPILKSSKHSVDRLYDSKATTDDIFEDLTIDLIDFAQRGGIGTLFAYGQTGSGKTFTINELQKLVLVWLMVDQATDPEMQISISMVDLAGNHAFDLLNARKQISVLEDAAGDTQLAGAVERCVKDEHEALELLEHAASFRPTASTIKNDASSRSHSICRIRISSGNTQTDGLLYLVDLAGSEAARDVAEHGADRMRETREINVSLSVLKDCVRGKAEAEAARRMGRPKKVHVPVRRSALTKVLKHVFDPESRRNCKTVVVACVNPSLADAASSKNTLRYAEMLRVSGVARV